MMTRRLFAAAMAAGLVLAASGPVRAAEGGAVTHHRSWSFHGMFGTFDQAALQRGFQVYREVCSACHSMKYMSYRNLADIGFSEEQVKQIAASVEVRDGPNDEGEMYDRPGKPGDRFKSPFPNDKAAAAANNGVAPPDLTLMVKARPSGADHLFSVLTGYKETPPPVEQHPCRFEETEARPDGSEVKVLKAPEVADGQYFNESFPGCVIAMPPPLSPEQVTYADGTQATVEQMAADVTEFLAWTAEPELIERKRMGWKVILFLLILTGLLFAYKRKVWAAVH